MNENLSLSATNQAADAAIANFRQAWIAVLALEAVLAAFLVVAPGLVVAGGAGTLAGARTAGALLACALLLQLPGVFDPVRYRVPVMIGMAGRALVGFVCLWFGGIYTVMGVITLALALGLLVLFHGMVVKILSSRP